MAELWSISELPGTRWDPDDEPPDDDGPRIHTIDVPEEYL